MLEQTVDRGESASRWPPGRSGGPLAGRERGRPGWVWGYGLAVLTVIIAAGLTGPIFSFDNDRVTFALFYAAVLISAWYGGLGPGLLATLLAALVSNYLFLPPLYSLELNLVGLVQVSVFILVALLISSLTEARWRAERNERRQREQLAVTLTSIGDAVIVTDAQGLVTFMNPVAESLTGWDLPAGVGQPLERIFPIINESSRATVESPVTKVLREGTVAGLANHTLLIRRDGRELPIDDSGAPIRSDKDEIEGVVLVFRDITERRQAEAQQTRLLRENQRQRRFLERLVETVPAGIAVVEGPEYRYSLVNPKYRRIARNKGELLGRPLVKVWPELPEAVSWLDQVYRTGEAFRAVDAPRVVERETGRREEFYNLSYTQLADEAGQPEGILILAEETTAQVQARRQVEEAYALLDTVFASAPVGLAFLDRELRFVRVNETMAHMTGQPVEAHAGRTLAELRPGLKIVEEVTASWQRILETGEAMIGVEVSSEVDGNPRQRRNWLANWYPVRSEGQIIGLGVVVQDITERRREEEAQRLLAQAGELLASSLDYETTLANVAQLAVPHLADWCTVHLVDPDGTVQRIAVAHVNPDRVEAAYELESRYPADWDAPTGLPNVLRTGKAEFYPEITEAMIEAAARDAEHYQRLREFQLSSAMIIPLIARQPTLGAISLFWAESGYHYDDGDLALGEELARRAALAVDNARLYRDAQAEIAARRQAEEQLKVSLQEKEVLLKEVHHRVKNNLQAVTNLIYLQSVYSKDERVRELFQQTQARIKSIALIHEKLYQSRDVVEVNFTDYVTSLVRDLMHSYGVKPETVKVDIQADPVALDMDTAVPLGVIVNELVSNALKYAFPAAHEPATGRDNGSASELRVELRAEGEQWLHLTVSDNGVGLPEEHDLAQSSLGLQLVRMLTDYMKGTVEVERNRGTTFKIRFAPLK